MDKDYVYGLFDLSGQVAVVTGGGGVLCGALSRAFGKAGVKVAVLDIFLDAAKTVADDIVANGGEAIAVKCDVLDKARTSSWKSTGAWTSCSTAPGAIKERPLPVRICLSLICPPTRSNGYST
jgi:NAD(P)-dependent dehydrogenase (short-subunit alcohol dehydrogenase family)